MSTARKYEPHYTVEDYQNWDGDWELWQGTAVSMSPSPFADHGKILGKMVTALNNGIEAAQGRATVLVEIDWIVAHDIILRPDAVVVCGDAPQRHIESVPSIVVEVLSDSTRSRDLNWKREMYQEKKVPHYLVLDPVEKKMQWLRLSEGGQFETQDVSPSISVDICDNCSLSVSTDKLFQ